MSMALPADALVQAIGWALLHLVWQGTLVATLLGVVLALLPGRHGNLRYGVSCLALALVVALGAWTGVRSYRAQAPALRVVTAIAKTSPGAAPARAATPIRPVRGERLQSFVRAANAALPRIVVVWLAGVLFFSGRLMIEWLRVRRLMTRDAADAREPWPTIARRLSHALGIRRAVRVLESAAVEVPSAIGLLRPAVLLPASTITGLSPAQLEMILAHELAHIRRHDFLVNLLQAVAETLLFYHPAAWWISRQVRIERENCCDDLAVATCGNRLAYARALLQLEELRAVAPALALSSAGGSLFARVRRICQRPMSTSGPAVRAVGALAVQMCLVAALVLPSLSSSSRADRAGRATAPATRPAQRPASLLATTVSGSLLLASREDSKPEHRPSDDPSSDDPSWEDPDDPSDDAPEVESNSPAEDENDAQADAEADAERDIATSRSGKPTLDELIMLRTQNVSARDIEEMRSLFPRVSLKDIAGMKAVGATASFVRSMRDAGLAVRSAQQASGLAALGVTKAYVRAMRAAGFPVLTAEDAQSLKALDVTPAFVESMRDAGVTIDDPNDAQSLRAMGVTPEFVRRMARAGYANLSAQDLCRLAAAGVTGDFIREMSKYRSDR